MTNTLATRKQSAAIRAQMQQIRSDLPYDVDAARRQVRQLTDWRYQFRKHPAAIMTAAAVIGYAIVPHARQEREIVVRTSGRDRERQPEPAPKGLIGGMVAAAATMAVKSGTSMLAQHLSQSLLSANATSRGSRHQSPTYAEDGNSVNDEATS